jgi:hypothetical protein
MKLVLDSLDYAWIESYFGIPLGDDTTEAFEFDNWHQPVSPLLIWDEIHWLQQGEFVLTEWRRPDADSGLVDTEYVRILYYVSVEDYRDINGDTEVSLGDYLLLKFLGPLKLGETVWYRQTGDPAAFGAVRLRLLRQSAVRFGDCRRVRCRARGRCGVPCRRADHRSEPGVPA